MNKNVSFHTYVFEKYCKDKLSHLFSVHFHKHHANLGQNGRGKVNRSRPTYYDIDMDIHLHRPTTVEVIQYLDRDFEYSAFFGKKNAIAKSVLDQMTHNLQSL